MTRCYSLSDRPDPTGYRITVKRMPPPPGQADLPPGLSSNYFHEAVQAGHKFTCYGCHEHTPANVARKHVKEEIKNFENCVECHRSANGESEGKGSREGDGDRQGRQGD